MGTVWMKDRNFISGTNKVKYCSDATTGCGTLSQLSHQTNQLSIGSLCTNHKKRMRNVVLGLLYIHEEGVGNTKERGEGGGNRNKR